MRFSSALAVAAAAAAATVVSAFGPRCPSNKAAVTRGAPVYNGPLVPNLKVAFIGDTGNNEENIDVLELIKARGAEAIFHAGDSSYENDAVGFHDDITSVLGADFPYFMVIGNHDQITWATPGGHQERLLARMTLNNATEYCEGEVGVEQACNYKGLFVVMSGVGCRRQPEEGTAYLDRTYAAYPNIWKISMWHKNQLLYQTGGKLNAVGWGVYESSLANGAIAMTGHEHSYSRTFTMSSFENTEIASTDNDVTIAPGRSFVVVSGLGGRSIRGWERNLNENPWWASCAASDNGVSDGALFCTFNYNGDPRTAYCEFVDRTERVWDTFFIYSNNTAAGANDSTHAAAAAAATFTASTIREVAIARSTDDIHTHAATGHADHSATRIPLGGPFETRLTFHEVPVARASEMAAARLQVIGAAAASPSPSMVIRAVLPGGRLTQAAVVWDSDDEDWETSTQWTSPNLKALLVEIAESVPRGHAAPTTVTLVIAGGVAGTEAYSFDHGECFAPTLSFEMPKTA